jgi:hypothetical protein
MYTLQGKPDQHATRISHSVHVWSQTIHISRGQCIAIFHIAPTRSKQAPTLKRNIGNQRQTSPTIVLGGLILPLSWQPWSRGERFWLSGYIATSAYWAHIPAYDRYLQYLLTGANPSVSGLVSSAWTCLSWTSNSGSSFTGLASAIRD